LTRTFIREYKGGFLTCRAQNKTCSHPFFKLSYSTLSRQIAVFGLESMGKLVQMDVLIIGMKGLGVEIGKFSSSFVYLLVSFFF